MDYETKTKIELVALCKERGIKGYTIKPTKEKLIQLLKKSDLIGLTSEYDIMKYDESDEVQTSELNYSITNQLQFILPSKSLREAKKIRIFKDEVYTETRAPWLKRHEWESDPHISLPWNPTYALTSVSRF